MSCYGEYLEKNTSTLNNSAKVDVFSQDKKPHSADIIYSTASLSNKNAYVPNIMYG